ncbi:hypothetical protein BAPAT_4400 [Bacillus anthracis str. SVA11]|nr:hypothetical protein BAPAT_4400 [Bacillus anthracis str. SVA11]EDR92771.1 hypothetical protein BAH_4639 [Bacillus anthracis str. A0442]EDT19352.1 hypothetical protein BAM_4646 [Bacillus anthracis str. A0465]
MEIGTYISMNYNSGAFFRSAFMHEEKDGVFPLSLIEM